jgi:hypothetical protein
MERLWTLFFHLEQENCLSTLKEQDLNFGMIETSTFLMGLSFSHS